MSLPIQAIDRLFERLSATYGAEWKRAAGDVPLVDVKTIWAHELSGFANQLESIAWALENLPERVPNIIQFRNLCRMSQRKEVPQLEGPRADPERVRAELAKLRPLVMKKAESSGTDHKEWARILIARHKNGDNTVKPIQIKFAREALGIKP